MHEKLVWGLILVALSGCSAGGGEQEADVELDREAIVGGRSDRGKDAAVVAISIGGEGLCTGSLIAPSWVLTARHCVSKTDEAVECPARAAQIHGEQPADTLTILVGDDIATARPVAIGRRVVVPTSNVLCEHDIALIQLDRDVAGVKPLGLGALAGVKKVRGVGFGKRGDRAEAGKKMTRTGVAILETSASEFEVGVLSCSGDSGGPALNADGKIVGIVSRGGPNCSGSSSRNIYTRVDAFETFIEQAIGQTSPATPMEASCGAGKRCPNGSHCNQGTLTCEAVP